MSAWSDLPNAVHIDRVLESLKAHPKLWDAAWDAVRDAAWDAVRDAARDAVRDAAWYAVLGAVLGAARDTAWDTAWGAILALIAYDDSAKYLDMTSYELKVWAVLSEDPAAVLLLPAVIVYEQINELERV